MTTRVALLTAAGSGIGAAAARELAAQGWSVAILSPSGKAEALAAELGGVGVTGSYESGEDIVRLRDAALSRWGQIDALVCSAGHGPRGGVLDLLDEDWHRAFEVYFLSAMRPIRLVAPQMGKGGSIVAVTSYVAQQPSPLYPTSSSLRAGLHGALKLVADELGPRGIRVNAVLPGFIDSIPQPPERYAGAALGRQGRVEEAAKAIAFLCSEASSYVTGTTLRVDGGLARVP